MKAREAGRTPEMIGKTEGALQELEETIYWLELLAESGMMKLERLTDLLATADEFAAILVSGVKTLKARQAAKTAQAD